MTDIDLIERLTAKAQWAKKHIEKLEAVLGRFPSVSDRANNLIRFEDDLNKRERTYYIVQVPTVPPDVPLIVGDILHNLRSALDHLACHLVTIGGGKVTGQTCFPIAKGTSEYMSSKFRGKIEGARKEAIEAIDSFQPYKGGNFLLWELHELNKLDKHRLLLTACSAHRGHSMTPSERAAMEKIFRDSHPGQPAPQLRGVLTEVPISGPLKAGDKLRTIPLAEVEQEMKFLIDIAFNEPQILQCRPVFPLLYDISEVVMMIILGLSRDGLLG